MKYDKLKTILADHAEWWFTGLGQRIDLSGANLRGAYLSGADLSGADLSGATLSGAYLIRADLTRANLSGADLTRADLTRANLSRAYLSGSCLDPSNTPNGATTEFEQDGEFVTGYRTRTQPTIGGPDYQDGQTYHAPWFSTCPTTECHPGLYLCPTTNNLYEDIIKVRARATDIHKVGSKWRCKEFTVIGSNT